MNQSHNPDTKSNHSPLSPRRGGHGGERPQVGLRQKPRRVLIIETILHVLTWCYILFSPLVFKRRDESIDLVHYLHGALFPLTICVVFYVNYFLLIPRFLLRGCTRWFWVGNVVLFVLFQGTVELQSYIFPHHPTAAEVARMAREARQFPPKFLFVIRGIVTFIASVGASVALKLSLRWRESEQARAAAELGRTEAELKNLKNQINPHFLLNTLNNIYALTAFNQEKAQEAILELSRMLRYMLYENQGERVPLSREVDFLRSYVSLMSLRVGGTVDVQMDVQQPEGMELQVAPLIFISLVENAFKHGVSTAGESFIHIHLEATPEALCFRCANSNAPKSAADKSPGGIGLQQVGRRLELAYPGRYAWQYGPSADGASYCSEIQIRFAAD